MTETHFFETAPTLSKDFARLRFSVTEDNLAHDIKKQGLALVSHVKEILTDVDWDRFNPRGNSAKRVFPILVAAADVTQDGREVLRQYLGLDQELIESYASRKSYPDDPERLKAIALTLRPYAEAMIEALDAAFTILVAITSFRNNLFITKGYMAHSHFQDVCRLFFNDGLREKSKRFKLLVK